MSGSRGGTYSNGNAFVTRYDEDLQVVWDQVALGSSGDSHAASVAATPEAVFVYGLNDLTVSSLASVRGDAWIARVML